MPYMHTLAFTFTITSQLLLERYLLCCDSAFLLSLFFAAVQSLHTLNDQISHFIVTKSKALEEDKDPFVPAEKETLKSSMTLMRHLLMDAQVWRPPMAPRAGRRGPWWWFCGESDAETFNCRPY